MNALQVIQQKLKCNKSQQNKFGGYSYRSQEDILEAVKPLLAETESVLTLTDEIVEVGGSLFVKATATLSYQGTTSVMEAKTVAYAEHAQEAKGMSPAQITGSTSSYARKCALNGLFLIDDTKDDDATNDGTKAKKAAPHQNSTNTPNPPEKEWLNPGTPNWEYAQKRIKEGVSVETIKQTFRLSKVNEKLLTESK